MLLLLCCLGALPAAASSGDFDPVELVNPLMGSQSVHQFSAGNTYPAVATPWGMNFWTPQTGKMGDGWAYTYTDTRIRGFKQTHQPSPWINDYGQFSLMPVTGTPEFDEERRASWFGHKAETSKPYYYSVYLPNTTWLPKSRRRTVPRSSASPSPKATTPMWWSMPSTKAPV